MSKLGMALRNAKEGVGSIIAGIAMTISGANVILTVARGDGPWGTALALGLGIVIVGCLVAAYGGYLVGRAGRPAAPAEHPQSLSPSGESGQ